MIQKGSFSFTPFAVNKMENISLSSSRSNVETAVENLRTTILFKTANYWDRFRLRGHLLFYFVITVFHVMSIKWTIENVLFSNSTISLCKPWQYISW